MGIGSRLVKSAELPFVRYDVPSSIPLPSLPSPDLLPHQTTKSRAPAIRYYVSVPTDAVGPHDILSVGVFLRPLDPSVSVRSASLTVERRIELRENSPASPTSASTLSPPNISPTSSREAFPSLSRTPSATSISPPPSPIMPASGSTFTLDTISTAQTATSANSQLPLLARDRAREQDHPASPPSSWTGAPYKVINNTVAGTENVSGRFVRDVQTGVWSRTLTMQWPASRSSARWALGETMATELVRVRFFVKVKVRPLRSRVRLPRKLI